LNKGLNSLELEAVVSEAQEGMIYIVLTTVKSPYIHVAGDSFIEIQRLAISRSLSMFRKI